MIKVQIVLISDQADPTFLQNHLIMIIFQQQPKRFAAVLHRLGELQNGVLKGGKHSANCSINWYRIVECTKRLAKFGNAKVEDKNE